VAKIYVGLIHAPVYNKNHEIVTTSLTNLDLHDIARACTTYGVRGYYIVHPAKAQRDLARRIMSFWQQGFGGTYNPDRREAFDLVRLVSTLEEALTDIRSETATEPLTIGTDAGYYPNAVHYARMRALLEGDGVYLLLFGTGWGLLQEDMKKMDYILAPICGPAEYNHLSVRSAVSIILDRLRGVYS
jgi:hypothetical protein